MKPLSRFLIAVMLLVGLLPAGLSVTVTDGPTSRSYSEDFEAYNAGQIPCTLPGDSPICSQSTAGAAGGSAVVAASTAIQGAKTWRVTDGSTPTAQYAAQLDNNAAGVNLCSAGQSFQFSFNHPGPISIGATNEYGLHGTTVVTSALPVNSVGIAMTGASGLETVQLWVRGASAAATTVNLGQVYTVGTTVIATISNVNCGAGFASAVIQTTGLSGGSTSNTVTATDAMVGGLDLDNFRVASTSATASGSSEQDLVSWNGAPLPAPTTTGISPNQGPRTGGTSVTVTGTGFKAGATVTVGGTAATGITVPDAQHVSFVTPARATAGTVNVIITNPDGQAATPNRVYTYTNLPNPTITSISPDSGDPSGGTLVTVTGTNFRANATVSFDGLNGFNTTVVSSTRITVETPPHSLGGVNVTVTNTDGSFVTRSPGYSYGALEQGSTQLEDYEDDVVGTRPSESWYTFRSNPPNGEALVSNEQSSSPARALKRTGDEYSIFTTLLDMCKPNMKFEVEILVTAYPTGSRTDGVGIVGDDWGFGFAVGAGGTVFLTVATSNGAQSDFATHTIPLNDWRTFTVSDVDCEERSGTVTLEGFASDTLDLPGTFPVVALDEFQMLHDVGAGTGGTQYFDNVRYSRTVPAAAFVSMPDLVGVDVDNTGSFIIVRNGSPGGHQVETLSAANPTAGSNPTFETFCNRVDGVSTQHLSAGGKGVTLFLFCDGDDPGNVQGLMVRSSALQDNVIPDGCSDYCVSFIQDGELDKTCEDCMGKIRDLGGFPHDYTRRYTYDDPFTIGLVETTILSWAFTSDEGDMGVVAIEMHDNADDNSDADTLPVGNGVLPDYLCTAVDGVDGRDLIYGGRQQTEITGAQVNYHLRTRADAPSDEAADLEVELQPIFTRGAQTSGVLGIGCGSYRLLTVEGTGTNQARVWDVRDNSKTLVVLVDDGLTGPAAMDSVGRVGVVATGGFLRAFYAANGTFFADMPLPAGNFVGLFVDDFGHNVWYASNGLGGGITRFNLDDVSAFSAIHPQPGRDTDRDGTPNNEDVDLDGDGVPNPEDRDTDNDGICNEPITVTPGAPDAPAGCGPGADVDGDGQPDGDQDDDEDGIPDDQDDSPGGPSTDPPSCVTGAVNCTPGAGGTGFGEDPNAGLGPGGILGEAGVDLASGLGVSVATGNFLAGLFIVIMTGAIGAGVIVSAFLLLGKRARLSLKAVAIGFLAFCLLGCVMAYKLNFWKLGVMIFLLILATGSITLWLFMRNR